MRDLIFDKKFKNFRKIHALFSNFWKEFLTRIPDWKISCFLSEILGTCNSETQVEQNNE